MIQPLPLSPPVASAKRRGRWRRRVFLAIIGIAVLLGVCYVRILGSTDAELTALLAEMDRTDPGWRLEEIEAGRTKIPDAENSALLMLSIGPGKSVDDRTLGTLLDDIPPQNELNAKQAAAVANRLAALGSAVTKARKLKDMPGGRFTVTYGADLYASLGRGIL